MHLPAAPLRAASVLFFIDGVGFGAFAIPAIIRVLQHRPVPIVFGFPAYGGGPFERIGLKSSVPLLGAFLLLNILEVVAGLLVWKGIRTGALLGFGLIPFGAFFWWGFALPIPPFWRWRAPSSLLLAGTTFIDLSRIVSRGPMWENHLKGWWRCSYAI